MHKFQGFQLNLQHIELIGKKASHHDGDAHGELEFERGYDRFHIALW